MADDESFQLADEELNQAAPEGSPEEEAAESPEEEAAEQESLQAPEDGARIEGIDVEIFDVPINFSEEEEKDLVFYLEENLPKMKPDDDERAMYLSYFSMYDMATQERGFPYENAPSLASSAAHDAINDFLDVAEPAFLSPRVTFTIDRDQTNLSEESINRIERTIHYKFFKPTLAANIPRILFEGGYLGATMLSVQEEYDITPVRERVVIKTAGDLQKQSSRLDEKQKEKAKESIAREELYSAILDDVKINHVGPRIKRVDLTKFWYPRNTKSIDDWQIVAEEEFYTRSALKEMAEKGQFKKEAVDKALENRDLIMGILEDKDKGLKDLPEDLKCNKDLDVDWQSDVSKLKESGDTYEDEFAIYRVTLFYKLPGGNHGNLRSWIQVMYCPASSSILGAVVCQNGFPYYPSEFRPVPFRAFGPGIAQQQYHHNTLDTELKSLFLAAVEQEVGAPLLIRNNSGLYATAFRAYPGSVTYTNDPNTDCKFMPFPDKSELAIKGMTMVLGSSPVTNSGLGYASGKRQMAMDQTKMTQMKARIYNLAIGIDAAFNAAWKIYCRLARFNTREEKIIDWVLDHRPPPGTKLYVLENEMDPNIVWTSTVTTASLSPDARKAAAFEEFKVFHQENPVSVNNPRLSMNWYERLADQFPSMDDLSRKKLLPTEEDYKSMQAGLGEQGAAQGGAPAGPPPTSPLVAQSPATPFRNPAAQ